MNLSAASHACLFYQLLRDRDAPSYYFQPSPQNRTTPPAIGHILVKKWGQSRTNQRLLKGLKVPFGAKLLPVPFMWPVEVSGAMRAGQQSIRVSTYQQTHFDVN